MELVVDANVLFAAVIKDGITRRIMAREGLNLHAPEIILFEFSNNSEALVEKSGKPPWEFEKVVDRLQNLIELYTEKQFEAFLEPALLLSPHKNDAPYFALALELDCGVWSNDKDLKRQNAVRVWSTPELAAALLL